MASCGAAPRGRQAWGKGGSCGGGVAVSWAQHPRLAPTPPSSFSHAQSQRLSFSSPYRALPPSLSHEEPSFLSPLGHALPVGSAGNPPQQHSPLGEGDQTPPHAAPGHNQKLTARVRRASPGGCGWGGGRGWTALQVAGDSRVSRTAVRGVGGGQGSPRWESRAC